LESLGNDIFTQIFGPMYLYLMQLISFHRLHIASNILKQYIFEQKPETRNQRPETYNILRPFLLKFLKRNYITMFTAIIFLA